MHLKENILRAFLDHELAPAVRKKSSDHLAACTKCAARLIELEKTAQRVSAQIKTLEPQPDRIHLTAHIALQTFDRRKEKTMSNIFRRPAWVAAGLALILGFSLIFPPVRALASSFLGLFRVQKVQVISFDPASLERFNNAETGDVLGAFFEANMTTSEAGSYSQVDSKEAAADLAGFTPRLPKGSEITSLGVQPGQSIEINIDSAMMNAGLESFGYPDVRISPDLDGQKIVATIPTSVIAAFGDCPQNGDENSNPDQWGACLALVQVPAPSVTAPDSFPVVQLGEVILQVLGMSAEQAADMSQSIDWASTLVLPIPTQENMETREVQVDGVSGTFIRELNGHYILIWVKDGILYGLSGSSDSSPAFRLAETLE